MRCRNAYSFANHSHMWRLLAGTLLAALAITALSACSNTGKYDSDEISHAAEAYYNEKYGDHATVVDISEETTSSLFGSSSLENFFCTMSDGFIVYYDQGDDNAADLFKDNRQSQEILALYIDYLREFENAATQRFVDAGYEANVEIDNWSHMSDERMAENIAYEDWIEGGRDFSGSYFHTKLDGQGAAYIAEERPYSTIRIDTCYAYISGPDAQYAEAFPTNVPDAPAWQKVADDIIQDIESFTGGIANFKVYQAPDGSKATAETLLGNGYINAYDNAWIIYDYVELGDGIWVSSDQHGVRVSANDFVLTDVSDSYTCEQLLSGSTDLTKFTTTAYKAHSLKLTNEAVDRIKESMAADGFVQTTWFSLSFAFDTSGVTYGDGTTYEKVIRLYAVEEAEPASDSSGNHKDSGENEQNDSGVSEPRYSLSTITYEEEPLPNGMVTGSIGYVFADGLTIVRL